MLSGTIFTDIVYMILFFFYNEVNLFNNDIKFGCNLSYIFRRK